MKLEQEERIVNIPVEQLEVDECNIRGKEWDSGTIKDEIVHSIKEMGVQEPLVVRKTTDSKLLKKGIKHTIICGTRRWNGSIEAGLKKCPCIIRDLTDAEAIAISITENKDRKDIPVYKYVEKAKWFLNENNGNLDKNGKVKLLMEKLKFSSPTAYTYLELIGLPAQIFELMKPQEARNQQIIKLLKSYSTITDTTQQLSMDKAAMIARELKDFPIEKQLEVAVTVLTLSRPKAIELVKLVKVFPLMKAQDILEKKILKIPMGVRWSFNFGSKIAQGMVEACKREKKDRVSLVSEVLEQWLKKREYL